MKPLKFNFFPRRTRNKRQTFIFIMLEQSSGNKYKFLLKTTQQKLFSQKLKKSLQEKKIGKKYTLKLKNSKIRM